MRPETQTIREVSTPYLAELPAQWKIRRLGSILSRRREVVGADWANLKLLSLTLHGIIPRDLENVVGKMPADFTTYQQVNPMDLVFCLFDVHETPRTVGLASETGMVTGAYSVFSVVDPEVSPEFLAYSYLAYDQYKALRSLYAGLRNTLRLDDFRNVVIGVPSLRRQHEIVAYLDRETAEIDVFTADQEQLINLLIERRTAAALHATLGREDAVHKGLLGRFLTKIDRPAVIPGEVVTAFRDGAVTARSNRREEGFTFSASEGGYQGVEVGDFVFHGLDGFSGATGVSDSAGNCSPVYHVCAVREGIDAQYAAMYLRALGSSGFLGAYAWSVRQRAVDYRNWGVFSKLPLAFPRLEQQQDAVRQFQAAAREMDEAIADAREAIALSKERRAVLISAAVTGKIDVHNHGEVD